MILTKELASIILWRDGIMDYLDIIQNGIDYIEENLKSELSPYELAELAGFSLFHYYRLFQSLVGMPIMQYVLRRKLYNGIYEISCGKKMIDVALSYGFETYPGFFKAFKREFNCSPTEYLKKYQIVKPYKINLLQEEYIMITDKKLQEILAHWDLKEPINIENFYCQPNGNKSENTWIINDDFVIKVGTNISGLKQHIKLSKSLLDSGFEAAVPIPTTDNDDYFIDNQLYFYLTNRVKGKCMKSNEIYQGNYESNGRYLGEIIGQLHLILEKQDRELICNEPNIYETLKNWAIPEVKKHIRIEENFYNDFQKEFKTLYEYLPKHIIHRDPNPSNIIIRDEKLAGFIDFELSERNIRIFDPCYAATSILSESFSESTTDRLEKWIVIFKNIITGYDNVCNLTEEEKKAIPYVIYSIQMICVAYFSSTDKYKNLAKINQKMLIWLIDNRDMLKIK